jgi:hypothetical protein
MIPLHRLLQQTLEQMVYNQMLWKDLWEFVFIVPFYHTVLIIYMLAHPFRKCLSTSTTKVSFNRVPDASLHEMYKIGCDWCSVVNVTIDIILNDGNRNIDTQIPWWYRIFLCWGEIYIRLALLFRRDVPIQSWDEYLSMYKDTDGIKSSPTLLSIANIGFFIDQIEARWCPFRPSVFEYPQYEKYIQATPGSMENVRKHLQKHETIKCFECNHILNTNCIDNENRWTNVQDSHLYKIALLIGIPSDSIH